MSRPKYEIAQVIKQFGQDFVNQYDPNGYILRNLNALRICRTSVLGGHKDKCDSCGHIRVSYNSCRNRHCPKCQASKQAFWVEDTTERIIDTKYFHIVFTVPQVLNSICLLDSKKFYNTLFSSVWDTLRTFGYTHYGVESGALAILHTWGQNLSLHPHIHCLVPAAGMTLEGNFKRISKKGKYLYPIKMLSVDFRSNMMKRLKKQIKARNQLSKYQSTIDQAWGKEWVVFSEPSFGDAWHIIKYLGQYTHRIAISNHRIQNIDDESVSFYYKDNRDASKQKLTTLPGVEFLRRFCMHILPKSFVKIRYYGILSNRYSKKTVLLRSNKSEKPKEKESVHQRLKRLTGFDVYKCPHCKKGQMHIIDVLPRIRSPGKFLKLKAERLTP
ncbi:MAG: IS91 family transposase [Patescibacteria group bacterium]|nr:IS91 family transposase [Patescibacteria group bacterium]